MFFGCILMLLIEEITRFRDVRGRFEKCVFAWVSPRSADRGTRMCLWTTGDREGEGGGVHGSPGTASDTRVGLSINVIAVRSSSNLCQSRANDSVPSMLPCSTRLKSSWAFALKQRARSWSLYTEGRIGYLKLIDVLFYREKFLWITFLLLIYKITKTFIYNFIVLKV